MNARDLQAEFARRNPGSAPSFAERMFIQAAECVKDKPYSQDIAIVEKYMRDHPENWHYPMANSVWLAIGDACIKK